MEKFVTAALSTYPTQREGRCRGQLEQKDSKSEIPVRVFGLKSFNGFKTIFFKVLFKYNFWCAPFSQLYFRYFFECNIA
jgi:hypothetical protein